VDAADAAAAARATPGDDAAPSETPRTPRTPSGRRYVKKDSSPGRERTDTSETERERRALDEYRDYVFLRDAIPAWLGVVGYLAFGLLGVVVIPHLYPAVTWTMVVVAYAVRASLFCEVGLPRFSLSLSLTTARRPALTPSTPLVPSHKK
jgi:hypothetical protein